MCDTLEYLFTCFFSSSIFDSNRKTHVSYKNIAAKCGVHWFSVEYKIKDHQLGIKLERLESVENSLIACEREKIKEKQ